MSDDLIKRSDAIKAVNREKSDWNCDYNVPIDNCIKRLNKVKSADRPQGRNLLEEYPSLFECSVCGASCDDTYPWDCDIKFCPNCGAKMFAKDINVPNKPQTDCQWK